MSQMQSIGILAANKNVLRSYVGRPPEEHYDKCIALCRDTQQIAVFDHSKDGLEIVLIDGKPLERTTMTEGLIAQGRYLIVGTQEGDFSFEHVKATIGVIKQGQSIVSLVAAYMEPNAVIAETLEPLTDEELAERQAEKDKRAAASQKADEDDKDLH